MNLLDRKTGLIVLSALFLSGCEDPDNIGLKIKPDQDLLVEFVEIPIKSVVVLGDSINTTYSGVWLFGNYQDPLTGKITAETYSKLRPWILLDTIADDGELDSAILSLSFNYHYGVDFAAEQHISIHELSDTILEFRNFSSTKAPFKADALGESKFIVPLDLDTILAIKLSAERLTDLFKIVKEFAYSNQEEFNQLFPGIALTSDQRNTAIFGATPNTLSTFLRLYYSSPGDEAASLFDFFFNGVTHYSYINANFEGTALQDLTTFYQEIIPNSDSAYLQGGTGLTFALDFGRVLEFIDTISNLTITQTDLQLGPFSEPPNGLDPPPYMGIAAINDDNRVNVSDTLLVNEFLSENPMTAVLDESNRIYKSRMTRYIQLLTEGEIEENRLILIPANNRTTLFRMAIAREDVVLKVFYTTFTQ